MSHNINSMMYYGEQPWHKLGKKVDSVQTSAEAIISAGLDWKVNQSPVEKLGDAHRTNGKSHSASGGEIICKIYLTQ